VKRKEVFDMSDEINIDRNAFVVRMKPYGEDQLQVALDENRVFIGYNCSERLLCESTYDGFREVFEKEHGCAGQHFGYARRFIQEMNRGDFILVPANYEFYIAKVDSDTERIERDGRVYFSRRVKWQNNKKPVPRNDVDASTYHKLKARGVCSYAGGVISDIERCLSAEKPFSFRRELIEKVDEDMRKRRMNPRLLETVVCRLMEHAGGESEQRQGRADKGADVVATFNVAGSLALGAKVAIQVKHHDPDKGEDLPASVVADIARGVESEQADFGVIITTGNVSNEAEDAAEKLYNDHRIRISFIDRKDLAALIVDNGWAKIVDDDPSDR